MQRLRHASDGLPMSDEAKPTSGQESAPEQDLVARSSPKTPEAIQGELWPMAELITLERERIASQDRRTDVTRHAIDAGDAADQRQYEYRVEKLRRDDEDRKRRHASGIAIVWVLGSGDAAARFARRRSTQRVHNNCWPIARRTVMCGTLCMKAVRTAHGGMARTSGTGTRLVGSECRNGSGASGSMSSAYVGATSGRTGIERSRRWALDGSGLPGTPANSHCGWRSLRTPMTARPRSRKSACPLSLIHI